MYEYWKWHCPVYISRRYVAHTGGKQCCRPCSGADSALSSSVTVPRQLLLCGCAAQGRGAEGAALLTPRHVRTEELPRGCLPPRPRGSRRSSLLARGSWCRAREFRLATSAPRWSVEIEEKGVLHPLLAAYHSWCWRNGKWGAPFLLTKVVSLTHDCGPEHGGQPLEGSPESEERELSLHEGIGTHWFQGLMIRTRRCTRGCQWEISPTSDSIPRLKQWELTWASARAFFLCSGRCDLFP